jgi:thiol-disulfide isomerase/thioredoxin
MDVKMRGLFFLLSVLGIVLALNVNLKAKPIPVVFPYVSVFAVAEVEGLMAYQEGTNVAPTPEPEPQTECKCKGTKKIKSGDGLITVDCPCVANGGCKCKQMGSLPTEVAPEPVAEVEVPSALSEGNPFNDLKKKYAIVYIGAKWCGPCKWVNTHSFPKLKGNKWDFGEKDFSYTVGPEVDKMITTVDFDEKEMDHFREFVGEKLDALNLPVFFKIDVQNKKIVDELVGGHTAESIHEFYNAKIRD